MDTQLNTLVDFSEAGALDWWGVCPVCGAVAEGSFCPECDTDIPAHRNQLAKQEAEAYLKSAGVEFPTYVGTDGMEHAEF